MHSLNISDQRQMWPLIVGAVLLGVGLSAVPATAAVLVEEQFLVGDPADPSAGEYAEGGVADQSPTVLGFDAADAWFAGPKSSGSYSVANIHGSGLSYSNSSGTVASSGGMIQVDSTNNRSGRQLATGFTDATTGTYYMSFLLQIGQLATSSHFKLFSLYDGEVTSDGRVLGIGTGASGVNDYAIFGADIATTSLGSGDTDTNLFVLRFDLSDQAGQDNLTIYRNPADLAVEPGSGVTFNNLDLAFDHIGMERFANQSLAADEFRIGTTFADVTTVPEPATLTLLALGGMVFCRRRRIPAV